MSGPSGVKVLLVDDAAANRLALKAALDGLDLSLIEAQTGTEALERLREGGFAAVLLDIQASPDGNRASRRMFAKEQRAKARGATTGHGAGGAAITPIQKDDDNVG